MVILLLIFSQACSSPDVARRVDRARDDIRTTREQTARLRAEIELNQKTIANLQADINIVRNAILGIDAQLPIYQARKARVAKLTRERDSLMAKKKQ